MVRTALTSCAALVLLSASLQAGNPAPDVLQLVPEDVGFCLIVHDLRGHAHALEGSDFLKQFNSSPAGKALAKSVLVKRLLRSRAEFEKVLQVSWPELRDGVLGGDIVLAYRPGPPDRPDQEQGIILIRAPDAPLLARLVERFNEVQRKAGDVTAIEARAYHGTSYQRRSERDHDQFYFLDGSLLAVTSSESFLREIIDRARPPSSDRASVAHGFQSLRTPSGLVRLWINPGAFEPALTEKVKQAPASEAPALHAMLAYWKAFDGISLTLALEKNAIVGTALVGYRPEKLPAGGQRLESVPAAICELWQVFPADALVATAGRLDLVAFGDFLKDFIPEDARKVATEQMKGRAAGFLGKNDASLPLLGPDWGLCITAPPSGAAFPLCLGALRVQSGPGSAERRQNLLALLDSAANLVSMVANQGGQGEPLALRSVVHEGTEIHYLTGSRQLPAGVEPAFALKDNYLVVASAPDAIKSFHVPAGKTPAPTSGETPLLRVGVRAWADLLKARRVAVAHWLTQVAHLPFEEATADLDSAIGVMQLFKHLEISHLSAPRRTGVVVRLTTVPSLRN